MNKGIVNALIRCLFSTIAITSNIFYKVLPLIAIHRFVKGFKPQNAVHNYGGEQTCTAVDNCHYEGIFFAIVLDIVVGRVGGDSTESETQGKENLGSCSCPRFKIVKIFSLNNWKKKMHKNM